MKEKSSHKADSSSQGKRFIDAAKAHECDESETAFAAKVKKIGAKKPKDAK